MSLRESTTLSLREKFELYIQDLYVEHPAPWTAIEAAMEAFDLLAPCLEALEMYVNLGDTRYRERDCNGEEYELDLAVEALANLESRLSAEGEK